LNEEFLVNASHQLALNTFLVFVHTARRCYRLDGSMSSKEVVFEMIELPRIVSSRGSKSPNKVSVGEPADGSLHFLIINYLVSLCGNIVVDFVHSNVIFIIR